MLVLAASSNGMLGNADPPFLYILKTIQGDQGLGKDGPEAAEGDVTDPLLCRRP